MQFARQGGKIIAFSEVRVHIGGDGLGKQRRIRLFSEEGPYAQMPVPEFQSAIQDGQISRLHLPYRLRLKAEVVSDRIGEEYTPQEALQILQQIIQDHATSVEVDHG